MADISDLYALIEVKGFTGLTRFFVPFMASTFSVDTEPRGGEGLSFFPCLGHLYRPVV